MFQQHQLVGIIEMDADSRSGVVADDTIGETLTRLRDGRAERTGETAVDGLADWCSEPEVCCETIHVLKADLRQLRAELEFELRSLIDRLLTPLCYRPSETCTRSAK